MTEPDTTLRIQQASVAAREDAILLRFCGNRISGAPAERRLALPPAEAKRLAQQLRAQVAELEAAHGVLWCEDNARHGAVADARTGLADEPLGASGMQMYRLLKNLPLNGCERSFKMQPGRLLTERYLLGIARNRLAPAQLAEILQALGMPPDMQEALRRSLAPTTFLHFGHEGGGPEALRKVYQEFAPPRDAGAQAHLHYVGYKWDAANPDRNTITRYHWHRQLSCEAMLARMAAIDGGAASQASELVRRAGTRARQPLLYLEVEEEGNPRRSYDINLYGAELRLADVANVLAEAAARFALPEREFDALWRRVRDAHLGHVSGGVARDGQPFMTVYYGLY